ncbi:MAG: SDR family oxidoreductase [Ignavibacterium sp.]|jgi:NAD(P)-dependent dehydrogenase (short-subunit alcohol dehydrogenase family)
MTPFGTTALVTGGSRGLGLASAEALAESGCDVVLNHFQDSGKARKECERLKALTGRKIIEIDADVGDPKAARAMVQKAADMLGGLAIVHSNAGICRFTPYLELDDENWRLHMDTNFNGGFYVTQTAARMMVERGKGGRIIFTTSVGAFRSNATQTHYCATKGGLHLLALGMAIELGRHGITVNCIAPGWMHTDINDAQSRDEASVKPWIAAHVSVGRLGAPRDLKAAVVFLASREADYVNGTTIHVDGGWNAQL